VLVLVGKDQLVDVAGAKNLLAGVGIDVDLVQDLQGALADLR